LHVCCLFVWVLGHGLGLALLAADCCMCVVCLFGFWVMVLGWRCLLLLKLFKLGLSLFVHRPLCAGYV